ncbi:MAG: PD40 domain-containing protein [Acidobacteria bacterium]|nr:PD40 domain-containing protein [Acidobacteriota bacterium]
MKHMNFSMGFFSKIMLLCLILGFTSGIVYSEEKFKAEKYLPKLLSTKNIEFAPTFTPDGKTCYFSQLNTKLGTFRIFKIVMKNGVWSGPVEAEFSHQYNDGAPFITPDGKRLFFNSRRQEGSNRLSNWDIYYVEQKGKGWSEVKKLGPEVNTNYSELTPSVAANGNLYFHSQRDKDTRVGIYMSEYKDGKYQPAVKLSAPLNSGKGDGDVYIDPQERFIIFWSNREVLGGREGLGNLFISYRDKTGNWKEPTPLDFYDINTPHEENWPRLSPDGKFLFFSSTRDIKKKVDIYTVEADFIKIPDE